MMFVFMVFYFQYFLCKKKKYIPKIKKKTLRKFYEKFNQINYKL